MAVIDFQVNLSKFLAAQRTALQSLEVCTPPWITVGPVAIVIDRIEFGNNTIRHNVPVTYGIDYPYFDEVGVVYVSGFRVQIAQDVTVWVTSLNDIMAHPNQSPSIIVPLPLTIVMNLDYYAPSQTCILATSFSHVEPGPLPFLPPNFDPKTIPLPITVTNILQALDKFLATVIPTQNVPIDIASMLPATPGKSVIFNAGVSVDSQLQRLAFRTQFGVSSVAPEAQWINFYKGFFEDRVQGAHWGLFLEGDYLASVIQLDIERAVAGALPDELQLFISTSYSNAGGKAVIMNDVLGIYDLPDPLGKLESNPHIPIEVSVKSPGVLTIDVGLPDIKVLVESFIPQWAKIFMKMSGPLGGFLQALIDSALSDLKDPDFPPECKRTAPNNVRCTKNVPTPNLGSAVRLQLTGLLALDDGISLTGTLAVFPLAPGALEMSPREFKFQPPHFSCSGAGPELIAFFQSSPESFDILQALVLVSYDGTLPCYICGVIPMNDPLGVFPVIAIRWDSPTAASTIRIDPPVPPAAYYAAGANTHYPCDLLVKTTTGTRLIRISPPPVLTQQDIDRLVGQMLVALGNCEKLMAGMFHGHGYNPRWSPRPPGDVDVLHLWEIEVNGLQEGETVTLVDSSQRELVKAMAVDGTSMKLSALLTPASGNELSILRGSKLEGRNVAEPNIPQRESASVPFISFLSVVMSQPRYNSYRTPDILM